MKKVTEKKTAKAGTRRTRQKKQPARTSGSARKRTGPADEALALAKRVVKLLKAKKGHDPVIIDIRDTSSGIADYFVVVSGNSQPHIKGMFEDVALQLKEAGIMCFRKMGNPESGWMVLDYFDVVIHILLEEKRAFYAIEDLWAGSRPPEQAGPPA